MTTADDVPHFTGPEAPISLFVGDRLTWVPPTATLVTVARTMVADEVGACVVGDGSHVEGVLSERDILRAVAAGTDLAATEAAAVESTRLVRCDVDATVAEVAELMMEEYVRHVLVERDGEVVGIVSARDVLGAYAPGPEGLAGRDDR